MLSSLRKRSSINQIVNSTANVRGKTVKKSGHTAESDSQLERPEGPVEGCDGVWGGMMISGLPRQTCDLLDGINTSCVGNLVLLTCLSFLMSSSMSYTG